MSKMRVCEKKCDECLFSANRIVSKATAKEIMNEVRRTDSHFHCHKAQLRGDKEKLVCAGSVEFHQGQLYRIMGRLGGIVLVDEEGKNIMDEKEKEVAV